MKLNKYIDHTLLKATATPKDIEKICQEAKQYNFFSVCVNSCYVQQVASSLKDSEVKVCSVIGFPLGAMSTRAKIMEAELAVADGANEIDMVLNIGWLKAGNHKQVREEITSVKKAIGDNVLKVILETCYLTDEEKKIACQLCVEAGADFVKTSTGFGTGGATIEDIILMRETVKGAAKIKASGGIRDKETALKYIEQRIHRIGTSNGISIVSGSGVEATKEY